VGYDILPAHRPRSYATHAVKPRCQNLARRGDIQRAHLAIDAMNHASPAVAARFGLSRPQRYLDDNNRLSIRYRLDAIVDS
jgi:RimJ/RimL family protein N-acetyltransferase